VVCVDRLLLERGYRTIYNAKAQTIPALALALAMVSPAFREHQPAPIKSERPPGRMRREIGSKESGPGRVLGNCKKTSSGELGANITQDSSRQKGTERLGRGFLSIIVICSAPMMNGLTLVLENRVEAGIRDFRKPAIMANPGLAIWHNPSL